VIPVVLVAGHLVDAPGRPASRFPQSRVPWVTEQLRGVFDEWGVGPGTTVISGGARGADIIAAEEGHARGAGVVLCLALPPGEFEGRSVDLPGTDWAERFRRLLAVAEVRELAGPADEGGDPRDDEVFARTNRWMVELARRIDGQPYAVIVWDGAAGDGPGGTWDLVRQLGYGAADRHLRVIDPTPP
jgi:hypothetical protein